MIGGNVIETIVLPDKVWVNCRERNSTTECAIYVERTDRARAISDGDIVWWQAGNAYWTPQPQIGKRQGKDFDIVLRRIGSSGVQRPRLPIQMNP